MSLGCFFNMKCTPLPYLYEKKGITTEECVEHCKNKKYPYAGFDHCGKCFCGENFMTYARSPHGCKAKSKKRCKKLRPGCQASAHIEVFRTSKKNLILALSNVFPASRGLFSVVFAEMTFRTLTVLVLTFSEYNATEKRPLLAGKVIGYALDFIPFTCQ